MSGRVEVTHVPKPWGWEKIWAHTDRYVGKILHINAGQALSVQYHTRKDETVYLLSGTLKYWVQQEGADELRDMQLTVGQAFRITRVDGALRGAVTDCTFSDVHADLDDSLGSKTATGERVRATQSHHPTRGQGNRLRQHTHITPKPSSKSRGNQ